MANDWKNQLAQIIALKQALGPGSTRRGGLQPNGAIWENAPNDEDGFNPEGSGRIGAGPNPGAAPAITPMAGRAPVEATAPPSPAFAPRAEPSSPVVQEDPNDPESYAPAGKKEVSGHRLVRRIGEPDSVFRKRLEQWEPDEKRNWKDAFRSALGSIPAGMSTLPNNSRTRLTGGNYAGAAAGGAIGGLLSNLLDPNGQARAERAQQLGEVRQSEADNLKQRETTANIGYKEEQTRQLPLENERKASKTYTDQLQKQYLAILRGGQGFDTKNNEQHRALAAKMAAANLDAPDLPAEVKNARWVHDENSGEDILEVINKDGSSRNLRTGEPYKSGTALTNETRVSEGAANRLSREQIAQQNIDARKEIARLNNENQVAIAGMPARSKAAGGDETHYVTVDQVADRAREIMATDPYGEINFNQALGRAYQEARAKKVKVLDQAPPAAVGNRAPANATGAPAAQVQ